MYGGFHSRFITFIGCFTGPSHDIMEHLGHPQERVKAHRGWRSLYGYHGSYSRVWSVYMHRPYQQ